jgi:Ca-activated chloride channel family protein
MKNRILKPSEETKAFGLLAWLEKTRISLPLKSIECSFRVCGDLVSVEIDQIFHQNANRPLDCLYTFPLPATAAVYRCEMHVNGRVVRAKVEEREEARRIAAEKKAAGFRTALVEMERDNLFTLSLGNVQPNDVIVVRLAYFQTLSRLGDWTSFSIPFCPGIRYIPGKPLLRSNRGKGTADDTDQVPDASRISPPRIDALHSDAANVFVEGCLEHPLNDLKDISSPSHPVLIRPGKGSSAVELANGQTVPDCDFALRWTELVTEEVKPAGWVVRRGNDTYALIRLRAPSRVSVSETYSQDVYFLIDRSGSMQGLKWEKAAEAFKAFLECLGSQDRVWATFFESGVRDLAEVPLPAPELRADPAVRTIEKIGTAGGTELLPALQHILSKISEHSADRPVSLMLITDGEIGNEQQVLKTMAAHSQLRVNVFGIDVTINDGFLQKLAAEHQGTSTLLSPRDDVVGAVTRVGSRLRKPVWTSLRVLDGWELPGASLPDLHQGEVLSVCLRNSRSAETLTLDGTLPDGTKTTCRFDLVSTSSEALSLMWAKRRIDCHLARGETTQAIELAKANNLVCEGAAFIAWDDAEKVQISGPDSQVYQPSMEPRFLCRSAGAAAAPAVLCELTSEFSVGEAAQPAQRFFARKAGGFFFGRPREQTPNPVDQAFRKWRQDMATDPLLHVPAWSHIVGSIATALVSDPAGADELIRKLEMLKTTLQRSTGEPMPDRFEKFSEALLSIFPAASHDQIRKMLAEMEQQLGFPARPIIRRPKQLA